MVRIWRFERQAYALGERRSIQLSYIRIYQYFTTKGRLLLRNLASCLGGGRSIQLSYGNIFKIYSILVLNLLNVNRLCPKGGRYNIFLGDHSSQFYLILKFTYNFVICFIYRIFCVF